ncbi:hypothetical protein PR048_028228 [Dryococelus australis]|uniref:PARG catalytic Macro domain-containing protein n=1 Tax=Dryococelus australis TaxID=614101 RepID=A0ABQ9GIN6_9NEOP|nr:hypothetical protein PR048_028228 [Dryococelus australis]
MEQCQNARAGEMGDPSENPPTSGFAQHNKTRKELLRTWQGSKAHAPEMALVMLPCDMPWWPQLQRHLTQLALCHTPRELIEGMHKIYTMCNIGLDPDEDEKPDPSVFQELERYLESEVTGEEMQLIVEKTIPAIVHRALQLKQLKPPRGLCFSLQQQEPTASLRTLSLNRAVIGKHRWRPYYNNSQKAKLRSILHYFDLLETSDLPNEKILFSRQVMSSKEWLTIEDWLECALPLCPLAIRHEGRMDRADPKTMTVCFSTRRLGGKVLDEGSSQQESIQFCTHPEILPVMQFVEALEDNEVLMVEGVLQVSRISDPHVRAIFEPIYKPSLVSVCCMDAENYMRLPLSQFEEDNILRELNKALLAFRQQHKLPPPQPISRRLSPIGESFSSMPTEVDTILTAKVQLHEGHSW